MLACGGSPIIVVSAAIVFKVVLLWLCLILLFSLPGERHACSYFNPEEKGHFTAGSAENERSPE